MELLFAALVCQFMGSPARAMDGTISGSMEGTLATVALSEEDHWGGRWMELTGNININMKKKNLVDLKAEAVGGRFTVIIGGEEGTDVSGSMTVPIEIRHHPDFAEKQLYVENVEFSGVVVIPPMPEPLQVGGKYDYTVGVKVTFDVDQIPFKLEAKDTVHCGISNDHQANRRVVKGKEADLHKYPWVVMGVRTDPGGTFGGTLIHKSVVLTSAHNLFEPVDRKSAKIQFHVKPDDPKYFSVLLGTHFPQPFVKTTKDDNEDMVNAGIIARAVVAQLKFYEHENFDGEEECECEYTLNSRKREYFLTWRFYDAALMILKEPVKIDYFKDVVCLPDHLPKGTKSFPAAIVAGWGRRNDEQPSLPALQAATIKLEELPLITCYQDDEDMRLGRIILTQFMGRNDPGTCRGDSGGPMFIRTGKEHIIIGVIAAEISETDIPDNECRPPAINMGLKVQPLMKWIKKHVPDLK